MNRYDAILEQIKKAQRHGFDALASHLDETIVALERSLESAKSTLQNALPNDPEEIFPVAELEAHVASLHDQPVAAGGVSLEALRQLDRARSQSELLRALLPLLGEQVGRAAVLVIRDAVVTAWSSVGFANPDQVRTWQGGTAASPDITGFIESPAPRRFAAVADPLFSEWLAGQEIMPEESVVLPISLRGKLMGMVYVDRVEDRPWNLEAAQALNAIACLLIDTLTHRTTAPSPMLAEIFTSEPPATVEPEPEVFAEQPEAEPSFTDFEPGPSALETEIPPPAEPPPPEPPAPEQAAPEEAASWQVPAADEEVEIEYDFEPGAVEAEPEPVEATFDPSATVRVEVGDEPPPAVAGEPPQFTPEPPPVVDAGVAPPPVRPVEPPPARQESGAAEVDPRHEEARRFARLLVSEIKLYNEEEVDRGRMERDLGQRLKEDIERSREMYEKRIPAEVREGHDYFQDELVRILADGDADALGM